MEWIVDFDEFDDQLSQFSTPGSNIILDFHGDPYRNDLVVFSDGNHHMALKQALKTFQKSVPEMKGCFYATTPPGPIVQMLKGKALRIGNLILSPLPHVFIGPPHILDRLNEEGYINQPFPFVKNQGNVLMVKKGNPKNITGITDLYREDVVLFLSNPETEKASFDAYIKTLKNLSQDLDIERKLNICHGKMIHHREAPQSIEQGRADAAIVFYHLALYYTHVFPDLFDMVLFTGTKEAPAPGPGNIIGFTHAALVEEGGSFGARFMDFLLSAACRDIYKRHGLIPLKPV